jgi:hypothetical protein
MWQHHCLAANQRSELADSWPIEIRDAANHSREIYPIRGRIASDEIQEQVFRFQRRAAGCRFTESSGGSVPRNVQKFKRNLADSCATTRQLALLGYLEKRFSTVRA